MHPCITATMCGDQHGSVAFVSLQCRHVPRCDAVVVVVLATKRGNHITFLCVVIECKCKSIQLCALAQVSSAPFEGDQVTSKATPVVTFVVNIDFVYSSHRSRAWPRLHKLHLFHWRNSILRPIQFGGVHANHDNLCVSIPVNPLIQRS